MNSVLCPCPIWGTPARCLPSNRIGQEVDSPRVGGRYFIASTAAAILKSWDEKRKLLPSSWLMEQRRLGVSCPELSSYTLEKIANRRTLSVHERADNFLRYLNSKSDLLGSVVSFYEMENSKVQQTEYELLAWTNSPRISEVIALAEYCRQEGWIEHRSELQKGMSRDTLHEVMLWPPGYSRLAGLDSTNHKSKQAFVAMWFDASLNEVYEDGFRTAIQDSGYAPIRIDRKDHNNKIDDEIIAEIRRSRFLVADFTQGAAGARGGVYYEAGFAHGLNIPVIFTCRNDSFNKVHFDTRQYNHITWETPEDLRDKLAKRIAATLGDGPDKKL